MAWHYRFTPAVVDGAPVQHHCLLQPVRFTARARLTADYKDTPIATVLQEISHVSQQTIIIEGMVSGNVTLRVDNMPWDQALAQVLGQNRLVQRTRDNQIIVSAAGGN